MRGQQRCVGKARTARRVGKARGQAAVMDSLFFMLVCSAAAVLLFSVAGAYNNSTNKQIIAVYNYEYAQTVLVSLHYAQDVTAAWSWNVLRGLLTDNDAAGKTRTYFAGDAKNVWDKLKDSSPSPYFFLCFERADASYSFCAPGNYAVGAAVWGDEEFQNNKRPAYTASVRVKDTRDPPQDWTVLLKLYY